MWNKKEDDFRPSEPAHRPAPQPEPPRTMVESVRAGGMMEQTGRIGKSIVIRGELSGHEDLSIEGTVEGKIELKEHHLIVGTTGKIQAEVLAKTVNIQGEVHGNIRAEERIEIATSGTVKGDLIAPRIIIADGARFKGSVDMDKPAESRPRPATTTMATVPNDVRTAVTAAPTENRTVKV